MKKPRVKTAVTSLQDQVTLTNKGSMLHFNKVPKASEVKD